MSLIQEALDKTQGRISSPLEKKRVDSKSSTNAADVHGLGELDREIERKIFEIQSQFHSKQSKPVKRNKIILFVLLSMAFVAGIILWEQPYSFTALGDFLKSKQTKYSSIVFKSSDSKVRFHLGGIAWGGNQPYALINGRVVRIGDSIEAHATVQSIEQSYVVVDFRGVPIRLVLKR